MKMGQGCNLPPVEEIASFHVHITSVHDATWQGVVEANGEEYQFQSELQLLPWVMEQFPVLRPEAAWGNDKYERSNQINITGGTYLWRTICLEVWAD